VCGETNELAGLRRVSGFGDKRVEMYGKEILDALRRFRGGDRASNEGKPKVSSPPKKPCASSKKAAPSKRLPKFAHAPCAPLSPSSPT